LGQLGVEYFFANAGSDFPSIVDAFAKFEREGRYQRRPSPPRPFQVPHEVCAVSMAHGYYLGRKLLHDEEKPPVVMVHSTVGTANAETAVINASRANIPLIMTAGRTAVSEAGNPASRNLVIHWAQESFDQAGSLRNYVKWDYELRSAEQLETVVRRAFAIAMTDPKGPVYLSLPTDLLAQPLSVEMALHDHGALTPVNPVAPDPGAIDELAERITRAKAPLIITRSYGRHGKLAVAELQVFVERWAIPVIEVQIPEFVNLPSSSEMHLGFDFPPPSNLPTLLGHADLVLVLDCPMPWTPPRSGGSAYVERPNREAFIVHLGDDPIYSRYPIWSFPADIALPGDSSRVIRALCKALNAKQPNVEIRRRRLQELRANERAAREQQLQCGEQAASFAWVSHCVGNLVKELGERALVVQEYDLDPRYTCFDDPRSYMGFAASGGLGFGTGGAIGAKLASPGKTVISVVGDGTYLLGAAASCHLTCAMKRSADIPDLPILWVVCNNGGWGFLAGATRAVHPNGHTGPGNFPLLGFPPPHGEPRPWPDYARLIEAFGGQGFNVRRADRLPKMLCRALEVVTGRQPRQALVNVDCFGSPVPLY
jgi:acetolactate synthase-1/2/3 large subunit